MGVTGLWRLIEPTGKPVPVETLENKVLAVDISIWLHQMVKGYQDAKGAPLPNAHLIGLFQRLCKLLYFRIKPVFVFDGGFPALKRETISRRQENKTKYNSESERLKRELALLLSKKTAIGSLLGKNISPKKKNVPNDTDDIFILPALPEKHEETESESEDEKDSSGSIIDLHSVDIESEKFKNLPAKEKYDLLLELKETRKMNSWGKIHELPKKSDRFSDFQMQRLLKRRKVQECLEETEKEMGEGGMSLNELESLLNETGIDTINNFVPTKRIASNNTTRFLLIKNVKEALAEAKQRDINNILGSSKELEIDSNDDNEKNDELKEDLKKAIKISLGLSADNDTSNYTSKTDDSWTSLTDSENSIQTDSEDQEGFDPPDMSSAKAYIMQYTDFTDKAIDDIICSKAESKVKSKKCNLTEILEELNQEKSIIKAKIELSSDDDVQKHSECMTKSQSMNKTSFETLEVNEVTLNTTTQKSALLIENEENVIDLDSSEETLNTEENVTLNTTTQASVLLVKNEENVIDLDSREKNFNTEYTLEKNDIKWHTKCCEDLVDVPEIFSFKHSGIDMSEELDEDLQKAIKMSLECVDLSAARSEVVVDKNSKTLSLSDSSDNEFEEVAFIEDESTKTVVQLSLDVDNTCEVTDDIFADIFTSDKISKNKLEITLPRGNVSPEEFKNELKVLNEPVDAPVSNISKVSVLAENASTAENPKIAIKVQESKDQNTKQSNSDPEKEENMQSNSKTIITSETVINTKTAEKLHELVEEMASEERELLQEKGRLDRIGRNITEQMTKDAQELLQIFGIPYIVAPMEAEAQCAFLEDVKLTDGTITDDSDIWLFGGKTVYKNFFNQKKHVLQFLSDKIDRSLNLSREQLILLALLVGSDYTTGIDGVGPVTAIEILASFPYNKKQYIKEQSKQSKYAKIVTGLQEFKKWIQGGKKTDNTILKKKLKNVSLTEDFPSIRVVQAYMEPNVEKSEETFSWGELDITILRDYTKTKFGWSQNKLDEIIKPVLKRVTERKSQKTIQDYFKRTVEYPSLDEHLSKRVLAAVKKLDPEIVLNEMDEPVPVKKIKLNKKLPHKNKNEKLDQPGTSKIKITSESSYPNALVSSIMSSTSNDIIIPKTERFQEMIPQRERDKKCLLENKLKAIEVFRKTNIDRKRKQTKRRAILPKEKANLSESSDSN